MYLFSSRNSVVTTPKYISTEIDAGGRDRNVYALLTNQSDEVMGLLRHG